MAIKLMAPYVDVDCRLEVEVVGVKKSRGPALSLRAPAQKKSERGKRQTDVKESLGAQQLLIDTPTVVFLSL